MSGVDYSKWDKMNFSDSEDEDEDDHDNYDDTAGPQVTKLDGPSQVTYSSQGIQIEPNASSISNMETKISKSSKDQIPTESNASKRESTPTSSTSNELESNIQRWTKSGASFLDPTTNHKIYWSQDRLEVTLTIPFDHSLIASKDIRLKVSGALKYQDRYAAVGTTCGETNDDDDDDDDDVKSSTVEGQKGKIKISAIDKNGCPITILDGHLAYYIHSPQDEDEEVDWEIDVTDPSHKFIRVTFLKAVPMQGLTLWWSRPLLHFPEIDVVSDIEERNTGTGGGKQSQNQQEQWKNTWEEAHRLFREKVKNREKQSV